MFNDRSTVLVLSNIIYMAEEQYIKLLRNVRTELDAFSPSFCLAKWLQVTVHLGTGKTHSCHHPTAHQVTRAELVDNPGALHNSQIKREERAAMIRGEQPPACDYCWRIENTQPDAISDRVLKSASPWAYPHMADVKMAASCESDVYPTYLEVNMGTTCNFRCLYCGPEFSSKWVEDIQRHGGYQLATKTLYDPIWLKEQGMFQIEEEPNPYEVAFLKWWPDVSKHLKTFRLTGGEPLLNKATFKVMEDLIQNPRPDMEFAINTNLCVPQLLIERLISLLNQMEGKVKSITVFTSAEATGLQQEFARDGMDWRTFQSNVQRVLDETKVRLTFMTTINALSVFTFGQFVRYVSELRKKYDPDRMDGKYSRVGLSINYLRHPEFMAITVLNRSTREWFNRECVKLLPLVRIFPHECEQLRQLGKWAVSATDEESASLAPNLRVFLQEVKRRRGLDHELIFPGLLERLG